MVTVYLLPLAARNPFFFFFVLRGLLGFFRGPPTKRHFEMHRSIMRAVRPFEVCSQKVSSLRNHLGEYTRETSAGRRGDVANVAQSTL